MKTNGSMICRQRHINNAIRERHTPWIYPLPTAPQSSTQLPALIGPTLALLTPRPSLLSPMTLFARRVMQSLIGWISCLWEAFVFSYRCVLTPSLRRHRLLCLDAVRLSPSSLPFSPCFIAQFGPLICHVERTCRQNRAHRGTAVYLNPLMGSMGSEVLLGH